MTAPKVKTYSRESNIEHLACMLFGIQGIPILEKDFLIKKALRKTYRRILDDLTTTTKKDFAYPDRKISQKTFFNWCGDYYYSLIWSDMSSEKKSKLDAIVSEEILRKVVWGMYRDILQCIINVNVEGLPQNANNKDK